MTENLPATVDDYDTGLEDFDGAYASMPRVTIQHADGVFQDMNSNQQFPVAYAVPMGLVKQRVKWHPEIPEGKSVPQCKSQDSLLGYPNMRPDSDPDQLFPWAESGLDINAAPRDEFKRVTIPCEACPFAKWTKSTSGKNVPPKCNILYTIPMMYALEENEPKDRAGIFSFKGSGITPWNKFMGPFSTRKIPLYSATIRLGLDRNQRGKVVYSVPTITQLSATDQDTWTTYSEAYRATREFLRRPPRPDDDGTDSTRTATAGGSLSADAVEQRITGSVIDSVATDTSDPWSSDPTDDDDDDKLPF